ncbi:ABC transporter ATP-binding protein [Breznakiella homolactica]|uniref:ABC transporter ATP-binding protein n=1 Tax=Breznakiella homolactica TaxID=2798577 RepID=A0A7T7XLW0_9SPIR|nr:ABC transporter ATP-binding protein [Breznakiella homolactica]QQO08769.1 ABC transporter ATP-binding protein/permease [Breznakiella homolactica]
MNMKMNIQGGGTAGSAGGGRSAAQKAAPVSPAASLKRLLVYMKKHRPLVIFTVIIAAAGTLMQVFTPKLLGGATTLIFQGLQSRTGIDLAALAGVLVSAALLYLGIFLASFLQERLMTVVSLRTTETLRNAVKAKLNRVPVSYFDKHSTGDMMSLAVNDIDNIAQNLQQSLTQLISSVILLAGTLIIMITISPLLTLLSCFMVPASILTAKIFTPPAQRHNKKYFAGLGSLNGCIEESCNNFTVIKSFSGEAEALAAFRSSNADVCESGWRARFFGQSMMHIMMFTQNIVYVLIAALGALRVIAGGLLIGNLQAFLQYSQQFASPVARLSSIWGSFLSAIASAERIFILLDTEEMEENAGAPEIQSGAAKVVFDSVTFGYSDMPLMKNFSLEVEEGRTVAIVGHTGAGKTTLVNLLERFYEIQEGVIRVDGEDIRGLDRPVLRRRIGMVLQDTWLFSGTILDNIKYGKPGASDEEVITAARAAYAESFILQLPDGYNTELTEDAGNISQGQRQLITIARAFLSDPEILILDEATSNVDSRTEMIVQKAMKELMRNRTSFVIAHRLSTIYSADRIVVMDHGDVAETGTHRELIERDGIYADIYHSQFRQAA